MEVSKELKEVMTRYLLGKATPVEQEALEDRYAADPEIFEQLVAMENDLSDRYARHELSAAERTAFERQALAHPRRLARAQFAEALATQFDEPTKSQKFAVQFSLAELFAQWRSKIQPAWGFQLSLTAATLLLILGGWWAVRFLLKPDTPNVAQQIDAQVSPTPISSPVTTPTTLVTPDTPVQAVPAFVTLILNVGSVRGSEGDTPTLVIPAGVDEVRLRLKTEASGYARYRLTLQHADGRTIHTAAATAKLNSFSLNLPARLFVNGEYVLALSGINPDGEADALSKTVFRVSKK